MSGEKVQPSAGSAPAKEAAPQPIEHVMQLAMGYQASQAIYVAARLGIADLLAGGPQPVSELARATRANEDALYRTLRALAGSGVFQETEPRRFALTPAAAALCSVLGSARDFVLWIAGPFHHRMYADFMHCVETGANVCEKKLGMPVFEYLSHDSELGAVFNAAMSNLSALIAPAVLTAYDFSGIGTLVDVAGGQGILLTTILGGHPAMKGIVSDLPHLVEGARERIRSLGLEGRCRAEASDFFESVPEGGDAYMLKNVIHDWPDDRALVILRNCHKALAAGNQRQGRLLLLDFVISPGNQPEMAKWIDLEMLALVSGRERTKEDFRTLLGKAGFGLTRVVRTQSPICVIEAHPSA